MSTFKKYIIYSIPILIVLIIFIYILNNTLSSNGKSQTDVSSTYLPPSIEIRSSTGSESPNIKSTDDLNVPVSTPFPKSDKKHAQWGGMLSGRVLNHEHNPQADVDVSLVYSPKVNSSALPQMNVKSDENGEYKIELEKLENAIEFYLVAKDRDGLLGYSNRIVLNFRSTFVEQDIVLSQPRRIRIRIESDNADAIEDASIEIRYQPLISWLHEPIVYQEKSDSGGFAELVNLNSGSYIISAKADGYIPNELKTEINEPFSSAKIKLSGESFLNGILLDDLEQPISGAKIQAQNVGAGPVAGGVRIEETTTDENGNWKLASLYRIPYLLTASFTKSGKPDSISAEVYKNFNNIKVPQENLALKVSSNGQIHAYIFDAQTQYPFESVDISLKSLQVKRVIEADQSDNSLDEFLPGIKNLQGLVKLEQGVLLIEGLPDGKYELTIEKQGYSSKFIRDIQVRSPELIDLGKIAMETGNGFFGKVVDATTLQPLNGIQFFLSGQGPRFHAKSNRDGSFQFLKLKQGTYKLQVQGAQFQNQVIEENLVYPGEGMVDLGVIRLNQGNVISGIVLDSEEKPMAEVRIKCRLVNGGLVTQKQTVTNQQGKFSVSGLQNQEYLVVAEYFKDGQRNYTDEVVSLVDAGSKNIVMVLYRDSKLKLKLNWGSGISPNAHETQVRGIYLQSDPTFPPTSFHVTENGGGPLFEFSELSPGEYLLMAASKDPVYGITYRVGSLIELDHGLNEIEFGLNKKTVEYELRNQETGEILPNADITFQQSIGSDSHTQNYFMLKSRFVSNSEGMVKIEGLQNEIYDAWIKPQNSFRNIYHGKINLAKQQDAEYLEFNIESSNQNSPLVTIP